MNYSDLLVKAKKLGFRKTSVLESVLKQFDGDHVILSAGELLDTIDANKTTVYRLLDKLVQKEILQEVPNLSDSVLYELKAQHHHHFVCNSCNDISELHDDNLEQAIHAFESELFKLGYQPMKHFFNLNGKCKNC